MKIKFFLPLILFCLLFALPVFAEEVIDDFSAVININADSSINITETISYDYGDVMKHGIYRYIPYKYQARGGNFNLRLNVISVKDENGNDYKYQVSGQGADKMIKIGDADAQVSGKKIYVINYSVKRAMNFFPERDELYWNVTGNGWEVPIKQSKAEIIFPGEVGLKGLKSNCYVGAADSTNNCISDRFVSDKKDFAAGVVFAHDILQPAEGLTIVVGLPKGTVSKPTWLQNAWDTFKDNGILLLPILALIAMFYLWRQYGRDPEGRGVIVAEYDAPDHLTPAEIGAIIDEKVDKTDISAQIIYLAIRGYLKIIRLDEGKIFKSADYRLDKLKEANDLTTEFDKKIMTALFTPLNKAADEIGSNKSIAVGGLRTTTSDMDLTGFAENKKSVLLSDLKNKFYEDLKEIQKNLYQTVSDKRYFVANPQKVRTYYMIGGSVLLLLGVFAGSIFGAFGFFSFVTSGIIIMIFSYFMPAKTSAGAIAKEHILGLKEYLAIAEADRIKFHNSPSATAVLTGNPDKTPGLFEKLLPYAMVLGVEKEWAKQFEGIYNQQPNWYSDPTGSNFTALVLVNNLGGFQSKANSTLASAPSSASSGGSGFSGGSSGGGFGGGGGGSW